MSELQALLRDADIVIEASRPRALEQLGVDREAPVGFRAIRLSFDIDTDATDEQIATLLKLTERYCVVFQTLNQKPALGVVVNRTS